MSPRKDRHADKKLNDKILQTHKRWMLTPLRTDLKRLQFSFIVTFNYLQQERTVFVLNPAYKDKMHALSMTSIDRESLLEEIITKVDLYATPRQFYADVVSDEFVMQHDAYRTYDLNKITNLKRMTYLISKNGVLRL